MRSAYYYPHTQIRNNSVMKTALLLWDEIHVISPWDEYRPRGEGNPSMIEAFEIIGRTHVPTEAEKREAHGFIEGLLAQGELSSAFTFTEAMKHAPRTNHGGHFDPYSYGRYEVYTEKLLYETWELLRARRLVGAPRGTHHPTSIAMGLTLMSILADCCAKKSFTRVTDRAASYAALQCLLTDGVDAESEAIKNELIPIAVRTVDPGGIPISRLIQFRRHETPSGRDLRHRLLRHVEKQAHIIAKAANSTEREETLRQFEMDVKDDYVLLKEALKLNAGETIGTKGIILSLLGMVGMAAASGLGHQMAFPEVTNISGGLVAVGGLVAAKSKFVKERRKVLQEHPTAYVFEVASAFPPY